MAKDLRKIYSGVRIGKTVFVEGMEDELEKVLSAADAQRLTEKGHIEGFVKEKAEKPDDKAKK